MQYSQAINKIKSLLAERQVIHIRLYDMNLPVVTIILVSRINRLGQINSQNLRTKPAGLIRMTACATAHIQPQFSLHKILGKRFNKLLKILTFIFREISPFITKTIFGFLFFQFVSIFFVIIVLVSRFMIQIIIIRIKKWKIVPHFTKQQAWNAMDYRISFPALTMQFAFHNLFHMSCEHLKIQLAATGRTHKPLHHLHSHELKSQPFFCIHASSNSIPHKISERSSPA